MSDTKKCPFCAEDVKTEAIVCRFCGRDFPSDSAETTQKPKNRITLSYAESVGSGLTIAVILTAFIVLVAVAFAQESKLEAAAYGWVVVSVCFSFLIFLVSAIRSFLRYMRIIASSRRK